MSVLDKMPTTDIKYDDIRDTLNANGGSVTNEFRTAFIASANYRKWARWKPAVYDVAILPALASFSSSHWRATDGCCGLKLPIMTSTAELANVSNLNSLWNIDPPAETSNVYLRMDDFAGYNPYARSIVKSVNSYQLDQGTIFIGQGENLFLLSFAFNDNRQGNGHDDSIDVTDIKWFGRNNFLGDTYFGVIIRANDGRFASHATMKWPLKDLMVDVQNDDERYPNHIYKQLDFTAPKEMLQTQYTSAWSGAYKVYPALFFNRYISDFYGKAGDYQVDVDGFIPLPINALPFTAEYYTSQVEIRINGAWLYDYHVSNSSHQILVSVRIRNLSNFSDFTFANNLANKILVGARVYNPGDDYSYQDETSMSGEIIVKRGETKYYTALTPYISGAELGKTVEVRAIWFFGGTRSEASALIDNIQAD